MKDDFSCAAFIPEEIIAVAGKKAFGNSKWLTRAQMTLCHDSDWATPLGFIKLITYGEARGAHIGMWMGTGIESPIYAVYSGVEYGGFIKPLTRSPQDLISKIGVLGSPSNIRKLFSPGLPWRKNFSDLVPDGSASDPLLEFLKSPAFIRDGEANNLYGDYLLEHRRALARINGGNESTGLIREIFCDENDLIDSSKWIKLCFELNKKNMSRHIISAMEVAATTHYLSGPAKLGYPEVIFKMRDFYESLSQLWGDDGGHITSQLVRLKANNYRRLTSQAFSDLKTQSPEVYMDIVRKGYSA